MSAAGHRAHLTREKVLRTAIDLADVEGLEAVSMRRLGRHLGVEAMSLYNHVANKDDLLDGVIDLVLAEIDLPSPGDDWKDAMRRRAESARAVFHRHPWAVGLLEAHSETSTPRRLGYFDTVLGALRDAGFSGRSAMRGFSIVDAYIYGSILQESNLGFDDDASLEEIGTDLLRQMADAYPHLAEVTCEMLREGYDHAVEFTFGLDLILDALDGLLEA
ncbi:MAG: TetR/AcrR family transcriptional regulator C-terminal domain-containing protein [Actinobacteria bacterium]|nr:TetR/AcrR family transcriptional regulator C-terminal domain-containing protein [Actinomycetota bacterium]